MTELVLRPATESDLPLLAAMNRRLIEDEGSRNPMTVVQLQSRMAVWLRGDWRVDLFVEGGEIVGYATHRSRPDEYFPERTQIYLRQFFIERDRRGRGIGRRAFGALLAERFAEGDEIVLDVVESNPGGRRFWESVGLRPRSTTMFLTPER